MTLEKLKAKYKDIVDNRLEQVFGNLVDSSTLAFEDYAPYFEPEEDINKTLLTMIEENMVMELDDAIAWLYNQANEERVNAVTVAAAEYGVPDVKTTDGFLKLIKQGELYYAYNTLITSNALEYLAQAYALVYIQGKELNEKFKDENELENLLIRIADTELNTYGAVEELVNKFLIEQAENYMESDENNDLWYEQITSLNNESEEEER